MRHLSSLAVRAIAASVGAAALALTLASLTHGAPKAAHAEAVKVASNGGGAMCFAGCRG